MWTESKNASCRTISPASVQLNKLVAAGELPGLPCALHRGVHFPRVYGIKSSCRRGVYSLSSHAIFKQNRVPIQHEAVSKHFVSSHGIPLCRIYAWILLSEVWQNHHPHQTFEAEYFRLYNRPFNMPSLLFTSQDNGCSPACNRQTAGYSKSRVLTPIFF